VATIAATIAGITTITISLLVWSLTPKAQEDKLMQLNRKIDEQGKNISEMKTDMDSLENKVDSSIPRQETPVINYKTGGTGFLIDPKGYLVTNAHVIEGAKNIAVDKGTGEELKAFVVYKDKKTDIAILKIKDDKFRYPGTIPYSISKSPAELAAPIFTLGYPRNDIVYGEGYKSSKTGFHDDSLSYQITIAANSGNSGSPILNKEGEVIGILNGRQANAEGFAFAIHSKYIYSAIEEMKKTDSAYNRIKLPLTSTIKSADREQQVKKVKDYVFMVKVN
jgi:S1-C subfamily serine protease